MTETPATAQAHNLRTFYTLIITQTLSLLGSTISGIAIGIHVFNDTGNATPLAMVAFFTIIPRIVLSGFAGALADRWDRRYVMILSDAGQALCTLLLLFSFLSGAFVVEHLYVLVAIQALFSVFQGPAFQASVTMLVPDEQRDRANAIQQLTGPAAGIVAPVIAGFVYALFNVVGAIVIDLVTFVIGVIVVLTVQIPRPAETAEGRAMRGSIWMEAVGGLRYLRQRPVLFYTVIYVSFINFLIGGVMALNTAYVLARTGNDSAVMGVILTVMNIGGLAGGIFIGVWGGTRPRMNTIMPSLIFAGAALAVYGMATSALALALLAFLIMFPIALINSPFMSILQAKVAPDVQGRVFAALGQISMALMPFAYLLFGPLVDTVLEPAMNPAVGNAALVPVFGGLVGTGAGAGIGLLMFAAGVIMFVISVLWYATPRFRQLEAILPDYAPAAATATASVEDDEQNPDAGIAAGGIALESI